MTTIKMQKINRSRQKWKEKNGFVVRVYEKYLSHRIDAKTLMEIFPGRSFKAIQQKCYRIIGRPEKKIKDEKQMKLPLGGEIEK